MALVPEWFRRFKRRNDEPLTTRQFFEQFPEHKPKHPEVPGIRVREHGADVYYISWPHWRYAKRFPEDMAYRDVADTTHRAVDENGTLRCVGGGL